MERQNRALVSDGRLRYLSSFELANGRFRLDYSGLGRWPLAIESTVVYNFGAPDERRAVEVRAQIGKLEERRDWQFTYSFQRVERDAVVGAFTSDEWWYHSDFRGSRFTAAFSPVFPMFLRFSAVFQKRTNTDNLLRRFQLDVLDPKQNTGVHIACFAGGTQNARSTFQIRSNSFPAQKTSSPADLRVPSLTFRVLGCTQGTRPRETRLLWMIRCQRT